MLTEVSRLLRGMNCGRTAGRVILPAAATNLSSHHDFDLQEVLLWIKSVVEGCGENITIEQSKDYVWTTLNSGKVSKLYKVVPPVLTELGKVISIDLPPPLLPFPI